MNTKEKLQIFTAKILNVIGATPYQHLIIDRLKDNPDLWACWVAEFEADAKDQKK